MKKILSLVLAALMIISVVPAAFALEDTAAEEASPYQDAIDFLSTVGLWHGGVSANEDVTRAQMALFVARFITAKTDDAYWATNENDSGFPDVKGQADYYVGAISFASQKGIVNGKVNEKSGVTEFKPEDNVEYREAITMIVRALGYNYKSTQYPWSYINKAVELGILDGISGIGYTDAAPRGVIAQLLYNAFFADVEGETVADKTFGVKEEIVMITASNEVTYKAEDTIVIRSGYVQYAPVNDKDLEPIAGTNFYADAKKFGLADKFAANEAVGNLFKILYMEKNGEADVLSAENLAKTYWNFGSAKKEIANSTSTFTTYLNQKQANSTIYYTTFGGNKYRLVDEFTALNNFQGTASDATGSYEIKLYSDKNGSSGAISGNYFMDPSNNVWDVQTLEIIYYFSNITGYWYTATKDANGNYSYTLAFTDIDALVASLGNNDPTVTDAYTKLNNVQPLKGFSKYADAAGRTALNTRTAYAKLQASDANGDGKADRATLRVYSFGILTKTANQTRWKFQKDTGSNLTSGNTESGKTYIQINTATAAKYNNDVNANLVFKKLEKVSDYLGGSAYKCTECLDGWTDTITFSNPEFKEADLKSGYGVIYYYNAATHELDVIAQVAPQNGYLRQFDVTTNKMTIDDKDLSFGYNTLDLSPLGDKSCMSPADKAIANNVSILTPYLNHYVTYYVVDDKVVYVTDKSNTTDYIVIDSIVNFTEDGIVVNAYTTVDDTFKQITISEFNGWTVGGLDYYLYYLTTLVQTTYTYSLPIEVGQLYQVVYAANDVYNITTPTTSASGTWKDTTVGVNTYGYITGMNNGSACGANKYVATDASDYWMILSTKGGKSTVYTFTGKLNALTLTDVDVYKCKDHDYVILADENSNISSLAAMSDNVAYAVYNYYAAGHYNTNTGVYEYGHVFTDIMTGATMSVKYASNLATWTYVNPSATILDATQLIPGRIYMIADGVLVDQDVNGISAEDALNAIIASGAYKLLATENYTVANTTNATKGSELELKAIKAKAAKKLIVEKYGAAMENTGVLGASAITAYAFFGNEGLLLKNILYGYVSNQTVTGATIGSTLVNLTAGQTVKVYYLASSTANTGIAYIIANEVEAPAADIALTIGGADYTGATGAGTFNAGAYNYTVNVSALQNAAGEAKVIDYAAGATATVALTATNAAGQTYDVSSSAVVTLNNDGTKFTTIALDWASGWVEGYEVTSGTITIVRGGNLGDVVITIGELG